MALRNFALAAAKRLGVVSGRHQRSICLPAIVPHLNKPEPNLLSDELGTQTRYFRRVPSHLYAREPSRTSPANATTERSGSKKKGKVLSDRPNVKERPVVFECQVCEALCVKRVHQEHFEKGVVIVRCLECRSVNLVADNLGLFKEKGSMQKFLSEREVDVIHGAEGSYELLAEDLVKMTLMDEQKTQDKQQQQEATTA